MGTDYPADMGETDPVGLIEARPRLDDVERRAILGGNAARLLLNHRGAGAEPTLTQGGEDIANF